MGNWDYRCPLSHRFSRSKLRKVTWQGVYGWKYLPNPKKFVGGRKDDAVRVLSWTWMGHQPHVCSWCGLFIPMLSNPSKGKPTGILAMLGCSSKWAEWDPYWFRCYFQLICYLENIKADGQVETQFLLGPCRLHTVRYTAFLWAQTSFVLPFLGMVQSSRFHSHTSVLLQFVSTEATLVSHTLSPILLPLPNNPPPTFK